MKPEPKKVTLERAMSAHPYLGYHADGRVHCHTNTLASAISMGSAYVRQMISPGRVYEVSENGTVRTVPKKLVEFK